MAPPSKAQAGALCVQHLLLRLFQSDDVVHQKVQELVEPIPAAAVAPDVEVACDLIGGAARGEERADAQHRHADDAPGRVWLLLDELLPVDGLAIRMARQQEDL